MKRLVILALASVVVALCLGRLVARRPAALLTGPQEVSLARYEVTAELTADGLLPPKVRVPKDHEVHLLISAAPDAPEGLLTLVGYHDRLDAVDMGPGVARELVFVSDRPGDDFAFHMGSGMVGRLEVTGSHLEEGHQ